MTPKDFTYLNLDDKRFIESYLIEYEVDTHFKITTLSKLEVTFCIVIKTPIKKTLVEQLTSIFLNNKVIALRSEKFKFNKSTLNFKIRDFSHSYNDSYYMLDITCECIE